MVKGLGLFVNKNARAMLRVNGLRQLTSIKVTINDNSRGIIGGYAEHCSSFDSRLIVFCSSELGIILLSASLTPACRLSPPIILK